MKISNVLQRVKAAFANKTPGQSDFNVISRLYLLLTKRERRVIISSLSVRLLLVALDIAGLALVGISVSLISGTQIQPNSITGKIVAYIGSSGFTNSYAVFGFASVAFFIVKGLSSIRLNTYILNRVANIEAGKSTNLLARITRGSLDDLSGISKKELFIGLVDSFDMSVSKLVMSFSTIFGEAVLLLGIGVYLAITNISLLVIMGVYFGLLGFIMNQLVSARTKAAAKIGQENSIVASSALFDVYDNFRQLASLNKFGSLIERYSEARLKLAKATASMSSLSVLPRYITEIALMLGFALLIVQRSLPGNSSFSAATMAIFIAAAFRIIASLLPLQGSLALFKQIAGSSRLAIELSERYPADTAAHPLSSPSPPGSVTIDIQNLSYSYPGHPKKVISNLTMTIEPRDYVAVMGKSGSGKSTLADLILGLRQPTTGSLAVNGLPVRDHLVAHPGSIAYVPQSCHILDGTLAFNVALGPIASEQDRTNVLEALEAAGLAEWLSELDDGIETTLGTTARTLSGGQIQRLGLARVLYAKPSLIILDESTSALDVQTEEKILATIDGLRGKVSILAIAHRGNVIAHADRVIHL